jgi:hypothetical protein
MYRDVQLIVKSVQNIFCNQALLHAIYNKDIPR